MPALDHFPPGRTPRPEQAKAVKEIEKAFASSDIVAFEGPTGVGKTFVAMAHARQAAAQGGSSFVVTVQKVLQEQYGRDFPAPQIEILKGRSNYACTYPLTSDRDASRGFCRSTKKDSIITECLARGTATEAKQFSLRPEDHKCPYWRQLALSMESKITLFNFHSFLFQTRLERFQRRELLVLDECHALEGVLLNFVEISFSDATLGKLGLELDLGLKDAKAVARWAQEHDVKAVILKQLGGAAFDEGVADGLTLKESDDLKGFLLKIELLERFVDSCPWVVDVVQDAPLPGARPIRRLRVRPVFVSLFARAMIFDHARKILAMSATILDPQIWARNLGVSKPSPAYVQAPCLFPLKNRPIYTDYGGNLSWKTFDQGIGGVLRKIYRILERNAGRRGIIHAHSERLVRVIVDTLKSPRFLTLDRYPDRNKADLLRDHAASPDSVIVASAFHEGVDLKDDLCRFQVLAKAPWPSTGDALVKARMEADGSYLPYQAALKTVQSVGRGIRHKDDWCETWIVDSGFDRLFSTASGLFPDWFTDAFQDNIPKL